jgi:uncharacterized protein DUF1961/glycosyl hydrolase family 123
MVKFLLFPILAALFSSQPDTQVAFNVWAIGDGVRVDPVSGELIESMQTYFGSVVDGDPKEQNWVWNSATATVSLKAARNEVVACQIIVEVDRQISGINIKSSDLISPEGHRLQSANVALFRQWYHFVSHSNEPRQGVRYPLKAGWYPDALVPFDAATHGAPFDIPGDDFYSINNKGEPNQKLNAQTNQAVWMDVYVPDDMPTGVYHGYLTISADNEQTQKISLELEVFDFNIPDEFHTTFEFMEYGSLVRGSADIELKTYRLAKQHRVSVSSTGMMPDTIGQGYGVKFDWKKFDSRWSKYFDGSAFVEGPGKGQPVTHLLLPFDARVWRADKTRRWWGKSWPFPLPGDSTNQIFTPEYDKAFSEKLLEFENHFEQKDWERTKLMFWPEGVDEPQANLGEVGRKPLNMARHYGQLLEKSGTHRIKYRLDIGGGLHSSVDLNGDGKIDPGTKEVVDYIQEVVDVWNTSGKWIEPDMLNMAPEEKRWTDVWFYNGYPPAVGTMMINGESLGFRTWQWIVWKYRLSGACDWHFRLNQGKNVFREMIISDSEGYPYHRNMYIYPGEQIGLAGDPLPSIRLKMIRRSMQDYEYFWLLTEKNKDGGKAVDKVVDRIVKRGLRDAVPLWPPQKHDPTHWSHRPEEWYNARLELASLIEDRLKSITQDIMPGFKLGSLLASESFSDNLDSWLTEGLVNTKIDQGCLYMESFDNEIENPKGNIWWKKNFENPYVIEFDCQSLSDNGLIMIFWNAFGLDGKDVFSWERTGKYEEYVNSNLAAYHCSFHRFNTGLSNLRKAPGFHLVASVKDPIDTGDRGIHKVMVASAGNRQRIFIDEQLVHDFIDESKPCLSKGKWQHLLPCQGTGSIPAHGAFGIRLTQKQKAKFDNISVFELTKTSTRSLSGK